MNMFRRGWVCLLGLALFLFGSCCEENNHSDKGLAVQLSWEDTSEQSVEVKDVRLWIFNADGGTQVEEKHYGSAQELAGERFQLDEGNYLVLNTINLTSPFTIVEETRAFSNWKNIAIGLLDSKDVENNAYFGVTGVKIDDQGGSKVAQNPLKAVLAELTIVIEDVPEGTKMSGKVQNVARCLFPMQKDAEDDYGLPSTDSVEVELPAISTTETTLQSNVIRLMPTVQGKDASHFHLRLLLPDGNSQEYNIAAPVMKVGGKYELRFKHQAMQSKMNLDATINNWKDLSDDVEIK